MCMGVKVDVIVGFMRVGVCLWVFVVRKYVLVGEGTLRVHPSRSSWRGEFGPSADPWLLVASSAFEEQRVWAPSVAQPLGLRLGQDPVADTHLTPPTQ